MIEVDIRSCFPVFDHPDVLDTEKALRAEGDYPAEWNKVRQHTDKASGDSAAGHRAGAGTSVEGAAGVADIAVSDLARALKRSIVSQPASALTLPAPAIMMMLLWGRAFRSGDRAADDDLPLAVRQ